MNAILQVPTPAEDTQAFFWPSVERSGRVPIYSVAPNPKQPRKFFDEDALAALAETIRMGGQREIITVRELSAEEIASGVYGPLARYRIISGERRWRASKLAGAAKVEIRVKSFDSEKDEKLDAYMLNENREGLSDIENARYLVELAQDFGWKNAAEIARGTGKPYYWVSQRLMLTELCLEAQALLEPNRPEKQRLGFQAAQVLARTTHDEQRALIRDIPFGHRAGARQASWLEERLRLMGVQAKERLRAPRKVRESLERFVANAIIESRKFVAREDFERLFENASQRQADELLRKAEDSVASLEALIVRIRELKAGRTAQPPVSEPPTLADLVGTLPETPEPETDQADTLGHPKPDEEAKPEPRAPEPHEETPAPPVRRKVSDEVRSAAAALLARRNVSAQPTPRGPSAVPAAKPKPRPSTTSSATPARRSDMPNDSFADRNPKGDQKPLAPRPMESGFDVNCWDHDLIRLALRHLSPSQYVRAWEKGDLEFQRLGKPKPDHLPSLEEVRAMIG